VPEREGVVWAWKGRVWARDATSSASSGVPQLRSFLLSSLRSSATKVACVQAFA